MRTATITLITALLASGVSRAQAGQGPREEFTLSAFILALHIPMNLTNADGTPMTTGPTFWVAIKNQTATPYSLCVDGGGWTTDLGGLMAGTNHCSPYVIVLPGETHFDTLKMAIPKDPSTRVGATVSFVGKPLGSMGDLKRWTLRWAGTVADALGEGERMKAAIP